MEQINKKIQTSLLALVVIFVLCFFGYVISSCGQYSPGEVIPSGAKVYQVNDTLATDIDANGTVNAWDLLHFLELPGNNNFSATQIPLQFLPDFGTPGKVMGWPDTTGWTLTPYSSGTEIFVPLENPDYKSGILFYTGQDEGDVLDNYPALNVNTFYIVLIRHDDTADVYYFLNI